MYILNLYPEAEQQLSEYYRWYETQRTGLGDEFLLSVEAEIKFIENNPLASQKRFKNYRMCLTDRFPYGIFYLVNEKKKIVLIAAIYHLRINPKTIRQKLRRLK